MKIAATLAAISAVTLIWAAPAQDALKPVEEALTPVPATPEPVPPTEEFDATAHAKALRDPDLVRRKKAYERVLAEAGRRDDVYEAVTAWALDTTNVELAWTAQLMLRELDTDPFRLRRSSRSPLRRPGPLPGWGRGDLFEELESLLELHRTDPFKDLSDLFELDGAPGWQGSSSSQGLSIETGPDGVKVEVREWIDGEEQVQTFEAESLEELLEAHPELKERIGGRGEFKIGGALQDPDLLRLFSDTLMDPLEGRSDPFNSRDRGGLRTLKPIEPRTDFLGVRTLSPEDRRHPVEGVRSDLGLEVVQVLPGTLADALGIEVGDIVVAINGVEIASAEDVKQVLAKRKPDGAVEVDIVDVDGKNRTRTWKPAPRESRGF